jgi:tetratricopeptide (TPR) repeat protein
MGGICLRSNELQEAEKYLKNAYSMMVSVKRLDAQADALTDLAKVYEVSGDSQNAIKLLDQAIQIYLQLGIKYKVKNVKALLQELKS